jgi:hypothetical protein
MNFEAGAGVKEVIATESVPMEIGKTSSEMWHEDKRLTNAIL